MILLFMLNMANSKNSLCSQNQAQLRLRFGYEMEISSRKHAPEL